MMNKETKFECWKEIIIDFFENNIENIKSGNPNIPCKIYKARKYIADKAVEIEKEKDAKKLARFKKAKKKKEKELQQFKKDAPAGEIRDWIKNNYNKKIAQSSRIIKATHVLKFTHSSAPNGGLLLEEKSDDLLLSTASLKRKLTLDIAHNNGALISVSRFLGLELNDKLIIDCILNNDPEFLKPFSKDKEQLEEWKIGFSNMVEVREIKTADKAKQLYFPLNEDFNTYHLLTPLFASSLCNEIDIKINHLRYKEQKEINKYRNHKKDGQTSPKYYPSIYADYPNLAVQNFGGKHAKNVSMLNANRSGKVYLFSAQPPTWQSKLKPPINKKSMFDSYHYSKITSDNIKYLVDFLLRYETINLSIRDPKKQKWLEKWTGHIIDDFLFFVGNIQNLSAGWSSEKGVKLKIEHQYLLDPYRNNKEFQAKKKASDWQTVVVNDFSIWLNKQLHNKDKKFTPQKEYSRTWKKIMTKELREYHQIMEADMSEAVGV